LRAGVINFVGGWVGEECRNANEINGALFKRGGMFPKSDLVALRRPRPHYSLDHSRANFCRVPGGGRQGFVLEFEVPGRDGHRVMFSPPLWTGHVDRYLNSIGAEGETVAVL
jgi:hypothetical protein